MSQTVTASEANQKFSELLRRVQQGERVTITSRGKPVAEMIPPQPKVTSREAFNELVAYFENQPMSITGPWKREDLYER